MQLLLVSLHSEELLDEVLSVLVEFELPDAAVVESRSGLELLERDLPIFAGLRSLIPRGIDFTRVVLCVIEDDDVALQVMRALCSLQVPSQGDAGSNNTAVLLPVASIEHF